jgi:undecaprenyl-diphosphatase
MTIWQAILLGILQGLTEFLPISSSAHLVIVPYLLGMQIPADQIFPFNVLVQLGTLAAVIIYFRADLWNIVRDFISGLIYRKPFGSPNARSGWLLILATIPAGLFGVLIKDMVEQAFSSVGATALLLLVTAVMLFAAEKIGKPEKQLAQLTWLDALIIGLFQALAIFPGISRSGSTIAGGMFRQVRREDAARFSFLLSIPIMLGAGVFSLKDVFEISDLSAFITPMAIGFVSACITGYMSIHWLLIFLNKHKLSSFAFYCTGLSALTLVVTMVR